MREENVTPLAPLRDLSGKKQLLTYPRLSYKRLDLLINFGEARIKNSISRVMKRSPGVSSRQGARSHHLGSRKVAKAAKGERGAFVQRQLVVNLAWVSALWAEVLAEVLGFEHDEALTLSRAVVGRIAYSKERGKFVHIED